MITASLEKSVCLGGGKASIVVLFASTLVGLSQAFTFENTATGYYASPLVVANSGLTLTVTTEGVPSGFVVVADGSFTVVPSLLGTRAIIGSRVDPLESGQFLPLRFSFSKPVGAITFAFGDDGGDDDSPVTIQAFNSANVLLSTLTDSYPGGFGSGKTLSSTFDAASYFIVRSGSVSGNENSLLWEVQSVTPVPEPSMVVLSGLGLVVMLRRLVKRWNALE